MRPIRVSAKAVIVHDGRLLLTQNQDRDGFFYLLPGGGQQPGETLKETVQRECHEEAGIAVEVHTLLHVREYIGRNHEFAVEDGEVHQLELMFSCSILGGVPGQGGQPDSWQVGVVWVPLAEVHQHRFYPKRLGPILASPGSAPVYLGDVN